MHLSLLVLTTALFTVGTLDANAAKRYPYQRCFETAADLYDVSTDLLLAVAATESNWDADARSHANAHGIMQIQWPGTAKHLGARRVAELYNPCLNISLGAKYLNELLARYQGSERLALAAYNYGPGRISSSKPIPKGAERYVATVARHRAKIKGGLLPAKITSSSEIMLAKFDSKQRATRVAHALDETIESGAVEVRRMQRLGRPYGIFLAVGAAGLTVNDHITLKRLGIEI